MKILDKIQRVAIKHAKPKKIIIFGSFARGDFRENSDINLLIITKEKISFKKRMEIASKISYEVEEFDVNPLIYTEEEVDTLKKAGHPLILSILKEGKIVYEEV